MKKMKYAVYISYRGLIDGKDSGIRYLGIHYREATSQIEAIKSRNVTYQDEDDNKQVVQLQEIRVIGAIEEKWSRTIHQLCGLANIQYPY